MLGSAQASQIQLSSDRSLTILTPITITVVVIRLLLRLRKRFSIFDSYNCTFEYNIYTSMYVLLLLVLMLRHPMRTYFHREFPFCLYLYLLYCWHSTMLTIDVGETSPGTISWGTASTSSLQLSCLMITL